MKRLILIIALAAPLAAQPTPPTPAPAQQPQKPPTYTQLAALADMYQQLFRQTRDALERTQADEATRIADLSEQITELKKQLHAAPVGAQAIVKPSSPAK